MDELISVVMTTYNHEKYIAQAIESVLSQDYINFELIIVDDGSTDQTKTIIERYEDDRIYKIYKTNSGVSDASNEGIKIAKGKWIALMSGDDISRTDRLKVEYEYVKTNGYNIVMSLPQLIDENGQELADSYYGTFFMNCDFVFKKVFRRLFLEGNYLCAPTAFIKKDIILEVGGFKRSLLQLQDYAMWLEISKKYDIPVISERLVFYRQHSNNLSSTQNNKRLYFEFKHIFRDILNGVHWDFLNEVFPDNFTVKSRYNEMNFSIEKALLLVQNPIPSVSVVGLELLAKYFDIEIYSEKLLSYYGFSMQLFFEKSNM